MVPIPVRRFVYASLLRPAANVDPRDVRARRATVCAITLLAGALTLGWSLRVPPGDPLFYPATSALALVWLVGGRLSGPVTLRADRRAQGASKSHGIAESVVWGGLLLVIFLVGAVVVSRIPMLAGPVQGLLDHARRGSLPLVALLTAVNGLAEEYFFRGALFQALPLRWRVGASTILYAVVTSFSGIPLLVLAAAILGMLLGLQRSATGGFLVPTVTHLVWSLGMLFLLPGALAMGARLLS